MRLSTERSLCSVINSALPRSVRLQCVLGWSVFAPPLEYRSVSSLPCKFRFSGESPLTIRTRISGIVTRCFLPGNVPAAVKFRFVEQSKALPMGELARRKAATEREIRYKTLSVSPFGLPPLPKGEALVRCKLAAKSEFISYCPSIWDWVSISMYSSMQRPNACSSLASSVPT